MTFPKGMKESPPLSFSSLSSVISSFFPSRLFSASQPLALHRPLSLQDRLPSASPRAYARRIFAPTSRDDFYEPRRCHRVLRHVEELSVQRRKEARGIARPLRPRTTTRLCGKRESVDGFERSCRAIRGKSEEKAKPSRRRRGGQVH